LAGAGSIVGLALASSGLAVIVALVPKHSLIADQALRRVRVNLLVLGFTVAVSLLTGTVVSLLPALRVSGLNLDEWLRQRGRPSGTVTSGSYLQRALIISEVALVLVLLVGAGLMVQSFRRLERAPTGFNPDHLLTVRIPLVRYKRSQGLEATNFYQKVLERMQAIPGVKSVGMANNLPFTGFHVSLVLPAPRNSSGVAGQTTYVTGRSVSPGYFRAMGIPIKEGRDFSPHDSEKNAPCVRIINEAMARRYWPGEDPVGRQTLSGACEQGGPALIVGVVADSKQNTVDSEAEPELYDPYGQHPTFASFLVTFVIRTVSDPLDLAATVRRTVWEVDHDQPVIQMRTMENVISESIWRQRFCASMLSIFAAIALVLSAIGIYGVLSYSVSRRTHEIGIRAALGATRRNILRMILGEGLLLTVIGLGGGIVSALGLTRLLRSLLYGVQPSDPITLALMSLLLAFVALVSIYVPARRATRVDPMVALRYE
jgi:putative ABC transport system permease protein